MGLFPEIPIIPAFPEIPENSPQKGTAVINKGTPSQRCPYLFIISCRISGSDDGAARG